ncbi:MAG: glycosyltransferase [Flavobacterium sp.]|uniref:glycosyltransferase family 2 protein n=1 Tax=Flavobacterium sp. TaxID=239 RepID=UPI0032646650
MQNKDINQLMVSVVVISYNHETYIEKCLENILNQTTNFDFEIIISNDCSTDNTDSVIRDIIKKDNNVHNIRYYNQENNLGMVNNTAFVFKQAKAKYTAICDGDDYWSDALKLQKQVDYMESNDEIVFTFHGAKTLDNNSNFNTYPKNKLFKDKQIVPKEVFISRGAAYSCTSSIMFKRELTQNLPKYFTNCFVNDFPLALLAISNGEIGYLEDEMTVYRTMADNSWSAIKDKDMIFKEKKFENTMMTLNDFDEFTNHKYHSLLDNLKSLCAYQLLHSYFSTTKSKQVRLSKYKEYGKKLNLEHRSKILIKLMIK